VTRYQTRHYVTTDEMEARRLAEIDGTRLDQIRMTCNVEPLHVTSSWILWSDGFTTGIGAKLPPGGSLSKDAEDLVSKVRGGDGEARCGLARLTQVAAVERTTPVSIGPSRGYYHRETVEKLTVRWTDGTPGELYTFSVGYFEGYEFSVYATLEELLAEQEARRIALAGN